MPPQARSNQRAPQQPTFITESQPQLAEMREELRQKRQNGSLASVDFEHGEKILNLVAGNLPLVGEQGDRLGKKILDSLRGYLKCLEDITTATRTASNPAMVGSPTRIADIDSTAATLRSSVNRDEGALGNALMALDDPDATASARDLRVEIDDAIGAFLGVVGMISYFFVTFLPQRH